MKKWRVSLAVLVIAGWALFAGFVLEPALKAECGHAGDLLSVVIGLFGGIAVGRLCGQFVMASIE